MPEATAMKRFIPYVLALTVGACVADTMQTYVGQDVRAVELAYGPPSNVIDMGGGVRAYQWTRTSVSTTPGSAVTTTEKDKKGRRRSETRFIGGEQSVSRCLYTFMTGWNPQRNGWIVTGYRQPSLDCALGDLDQG
jgi:hypothetical protein